MESNPSVINSTQRAIPDASNDWTQEPSTSITNPHMVSALNNSNKRVDPLGSAKSST